MTADRPTLRERYADDLRSGSLPVLLTAVPIAMVVALGSAWYWDEFAGGFLLLMTIGGLVPYAHENHWPQDGPWTRDVLWTIAASAVASGLFAGSYLLAGVPLSDPTYRAVVAFGVTVLGGGTVVGSLRRRR
ncbi:hypothetical protein HYG81_12970 [Natrinema zhouii]|uniref:Uncharacterized protein n=1 Tax=Natrinema zhouii TaxID=1710539 RepID=A0A7D6CPJ0_9EURY|nr:hypothetical protein [Natrinema zhouii]QLK25013.1 hypothetical protein HYG81_12970 [Natrinema zhouii]